VIRFWWCHTVGCPMYDRAVQQVSGTCGQCGELLHIASVDEAAGETALD
jgi:hypothetical protein